MYALGSSSEDASARLAIGAARIGKGSKPEAMQEPNLMPFFVSFAKAGDASWVPAELEDGWLVDDVVTLDDESFGDC
jgi:hypothetical protein